uniref:Uncharacterized protein n=1 Tax=viral metagenome TaxID=1070528 RepID=A0A6M3IWS5_9ZZZZ
MEISVKYIDLKDRQVRVTEQEAKGLRMTHDNFSPDWKSGEEPRGEMTFTDEILPSPKPPEPVRDLAAEIDKLKSDVLLLQSQIVKQI